LYGCETWFLTLREYHRLRVWSKRDEVTREWRRLHNEELYDMYSPLNTVRALGLIQPPSKWRFFPEGTAAVA
jgi:hypothetical protein